MEVSPYSIYIDKRPLRIAFLVNPEADLKWFDRIFKFNQEKWGGRFNPVILTNGKTIEEQEWKFLREYDPDIIKSLVPLDNELRKKIHIFLSPFKLEFN